MENQTSPGLENNNAKPSQNKIMYLLSNPLFSSIAGLASIISLILAIYFYYEAKEYPELRFAVYPIKGVILKRGDISKLSTSYDGKNIDGDITKTQVAIWNNGKRSIKSEDILNDQKNIQISTENKVPILEAEIRKYSRPEIQCTLNKEQISSGAVFLSWKILEQNDGCVIQLIYEGDTSIDVYASGVIEGQAKIATTPSNQKFFISAIAVAVAGTIICLIFLFRTFNIYVASSEPEFKKKMRNTLIAFLIGLGFCLINVFLWLYFYSSSSDLPFSFE